MKPIFSFQLDSLAGMSHEMRLILGASLVGEPLSLRSLADK